MSDDDDLTAQQLAVALKVSVKTVRRWHEDRKVTGYRTPGGHLRFPRAELDRLTNTEVPA